MRPELKRKLEKEMKRSKKRPLMVVTFSFLLISSVLTASLVPLSTTTIQGVSVKLTAVPTWKVGNLPRMIVRLDEGRQIRAKMSRKLSFLPNSRVELHQGKTLIGFTTYRVVRYIDGT